MDPRIALGRVLRQYRINAGLTQWDIAVALGYSTAQFISNWERGVSAPPDEAIGRLATMFKVPPRQLVDLVVDCEQRALTSRARALLKLARRTP